MKRTIVLALLFLLMICACAPIYRADNFQEIANSHKVIAVLPPKVVLEIKKADQAEAIKSQEKLEAEHYQMALADYINNKNTQGEFSVSAQRPEETNRILAERGITSLTGKSYKELAELLGVDAVVSSRVSLAKPMTNGEALLTSMLTGFAPASKITTVDISLTDRNTGKMFWNYNWATGGTFVSTQSMIKGMMNSATKRLPYKTSTTRTER